MRAHGLRSFEMLGTQPRRSAWKPYRHGKPRPLGQSVPHFRRIVDNARGFPRLRTHERMRNQVLGCELVWTIGQFDRLSFFGRSRGRRRPGERSGDGICGMKPYLRPHYRWRREVLGV